MKMNDLLSEGCDVVLHVGTGPSRRQEQTGSPLVVRDGSKRLKGRVQNQDGVAHLRAECISPLAVSAAATQSHESID